ncbi:MAG: sensor histidine kinase KdpD [Eubacteriales bacterium]|nr:sensor histidine kinase KdpD [Eubacteriales bacterium]
MEENRPDPDRLLKQVKEEEKEQVTGKLKIFFGYAAGVGKTYAMLEAAHEAAASGIDVVAGYIEPHARPETMALMEGLERLASLDVPYKNIILHELDLDGALKRRPQLLLVDELAHTNAPGCRHTKRYQDIQEILRAGIDVYTTVNVQHLESLNDIVAAITGVAVQERIPDFVFDSADQVELVDIEPKELLERLRRGKVYRPNQAGIAMDNFFTLDHLTALRELALRRTADWVNRMTEKNREHDRDSEYYTGEHILVCLSASPSNAKVIRAAARMASAFRGRFSAVYVEQPGAEELQNEDALRLQMNRRLAEQLGARAVTLYGGDITGQIAEYARVSGVSKIVLGRSYTRRSRFGKAESFADQLTALLPSQEIYLIPDNYTKLYRRKKNVAAVHPMPQEMSRNFLRDMLATLGILAICTAVNLLFAGLGFEDANIVTVYILGVLLTALITENQIYNLLASVLSVLCYNMFFISPVGSFGVYNPGNLVTFGVMFLSGFIIAFLSRKVKTYGRQAARKAWRMEILLDTSRKLQMTAGEENVARIVSSQLGRLLDKDVVYYPGNPQQIGRPWCFPRQKNSRIGDLLSRDENAVATWSYRNNKRAGASTQTLPGAKGLYMAVRSANHVYGVAGIGLEQDFLPAFEESLVNALLSEAALALEKEKTVEEKNATAMKMKQEQLRSNLLRSISHDLRTPLTSISGNSGMLLERGDTLTDKQRRQLCEDIYDDSVWLYNLVENLLSITRIENGSMELKLQPELLEDVIKEALAHIHRRLRKHSVEVKLEDELLMAWMDPKLIMQVILNLLDNAVKYTPEGSVVTISARRFDDRVYVSISDNGPGIPDEMKEKIFDLFYTGENRPGDGVRSMGVGLSLCRSIVEAHGGTLKVRDNVPRGSRFIFDLKAENVGGREDEKNGSKA